MPFFRHPIHQASYLFPIAFPFHSQSTDLMKLLHNSFFQTWYENIISF